MGRDWVETWGRWGALMSCVGLPACGAELGDAADGAALADGVSESPVARQDGFYYLEQDSTLRVEAASGVLANDSGPAPLTAVAEAVTRGNGAVDLRPDGSFDYTPKA